MFAFKSENVHFQKEIANTNERLRFLKSKYYLLKHLYLSQDKCKWISDKQQRDVRNIK